MQTDQGHKSDRCTNGFFFLFSSQFASLTQHQALSLTHVLCGMKKYCVLMLCPDGGYLLSLGDKWIFTTSFTKAPSLLVSPY